MAALEFYFTLERGIGNVTTLHLESGLTGLLATINMADEGVAGKGKDSGCGREGLSFLKSRFTSASVYFGERTHVHVLETNIFWIFTFD